MPLVELLQPHQRLVQLRGGVELLVGDPGVLRQLERRHPAAALGPLAGAGTVHQQVPHNAGGEGEEVAPIGERRGRALHEPQIGLVDQAGGVQRVLLGLGPEPLPGDGAEPVVDERDQAVERLGVARLPPVQEVGDLRGRRGHTLRDYRPDGGPARAA